MLLLNQLCAIPADELVDACCHFCTQCVLDMIVVFIMYPYWYNSTTIYDLLFLINFYLIGYWSRSVTSSDILTMADMTPYQFALMLVEACKLQDIRLPIKNIVTNDKELFNDVIPRRLNVKLTLSSTKSTRRTVRSLPSKRTSNSSKLSWMTWGSTASGTASEWLVFRRTQATMTSMRLYSRSVS